jgi:His/Glu/Gln/Arg/opine family amino acid ABC transporter permease subunit
MAIAQDVRPDRGLRHVVAESTRTAVAIAVTGGIGLAAILIGTVVVIVMKGATPVKSLIAGIESTDLQVNLLAGIALGVVALAAGVGSFRRMPTKVSRNEAVAGAVLGGQAVVLGALLYAFSRTDVKTFAIEFLNFHVLGPHLSAFVNAAKNTIVLAFAGEAFGISGGLLLSVFAISQRAVVRAPARAYINFFRGTPLLWQLIFIGIGIPTALGLNIGTYEAAVIALSLNTAAYAAEVFRAGIQSVERSQLEAARGLGMSYLQAMRYAILPQAIRRVIPPLMNEFVILIKDTSLVIVLGLTAGERELMSLGNFLLANSFNATFLIATALGYLVVTLPLIRIVNVLEKHLRSGLVGIGA